jgi:hypothetical protein
MFIGFPQDPLLYTAARYLKRGPEKSVLIMQRVFQIKMHKYCEKYQKKCKRG